MEGTGVRLTQTCEHLNSKVRKKVCPGITLLKQMKSIMHEKLISDLYSFNY